MLSKSAAKSFFLVGTGLCTGAFLLLTLDTLKQVPHQTHQSNLSAQAIRGKKLWEKNNCMGCHTIMGEGAYYAPELTKVYERRGEGFIRMMLKDPEAMYPGQRKMVNYHFKEDEITDLVEFLKWVGNADLNGFPAKTNLNNVAVAEVTTPTGQTSVVASKVGRPAIFNQLCIACHMLQGQGGNTGPSLDDVGARRDLSYLSRWLKNPEDLKPGAKMPKLPLTDADIAELSAFLSQQKGGQP